MDTSRDYRILLAEKAVEKYMSIVKASSLPYLVKREELLSYAREAHSLVMTLKYSFLPPEQIVGSELLAKLSALADRMVSFVEERPLRPLSGRDRLNVAYVRWIGITLGGLSDRFRLGEDNLPEYAVDILGVRVESASRLRGSRGLWVANVTPGYEFFTVVTNLGDVRSGQVRAVAVLPPRMFNEVVSEAMFCSGALDEGYVGRRPESSLLELNSVRLAVEEAISKRL